VVDLDRDGRAEVLVGGAYSLVSILRSRPRGLIASGHDYPLVGNNPIAFAPGDFDADGSVDLCVVNGDDDDIRTLWGTGDGALELRAGDDDLPVGTSPQDIAVGHFDDDDELDVVVTNAGNNSLTVWHSVGAVAPSYPYREFLDPTLPADPTKIVTGYFNDDLRLDIALLSASNVVVIHGEPGGTLDKNNPEVYEVGPGPVEIVSADLNYDGLPDLATISSGKAVSVLYAQVDRTFGSFEEYDLSPVLEWHDASVAIGAGDLNDDGLIDLFASFHQHTSSIKSAVVLLYRHEAGGFEEPERLDCPGDYLGDLAVEDFDRDTIPDLVVAGFFAQHIWFGAEGGELVHERYACRNGNYPRFSMTVADFNNDGRPDIANIESSPVGIGIMLNQSNAKIRGDLTVTDVTIKDSEGVIVGGGEAGEVVTIEWTVQNQLDTPITGMWTDAVYLSLDGAWEIGDIRLGTVDFIGSLDEAGGENDSVVRSFDVALPGAFPGDWRILVRTDATDAVDETDVPSPGGEFDNTADTPINMHLPWLDVCLVDAPSCPGLDGTFTRQGRVLYYELDAVADEDLLITLDSAADSGFNELYIRYEAFPSRSVFDERYPQPFDTLETPDQTVRVPGTQAGTYYVMAYAGQFPPESTVDFNIRAEYLPLALTRITPDHGGNTGQVTVTFIGSGFREGIQVALLPYGGAEILPESSLHTNMGLLTATFNLDGFDLEGQFEQGCGLRLTNPGGSEILLEGGFTIEQGMEIDISGVLDGPSSVRPGVPARYKVWINNGG
ncbi:MAG: VCBS repeat-containing protein, partial [Planctomycetes bacterium]|nr:VCBS repeat-containing protein [Planctomycetota bacterium]